MLHTQPALKNDHSDGVALREIIRLVGVFVLVFSLIVCVPMFAARIVHRGAMPDVTAWLHTSDAGVSIRVYQTQTSATTTMPLNSYILEVLSAEFAPGAPIQSLEAAAIATRTYAMHAIETAAHTKTIASTHQADVTDNSAFDLPMATETDIQSEYPSQALPFLTELQTAIETTDGLVISYQQKPILAFMFALSPGETRSSKAAFGQTIPYLTTVACPDDAALAADTAINTFTPQDIAQALNLSVSQVNGKLSLNKSSDGFVQTVDVGQTSILGSRFASSLQLPSDDFSLKRDANQDVVITTKGRGTDIGMSLHEAQALANRGQTWQAILAHFYPGTKVVLAANLPSLAHVVAK